jgi:hypothetical protein
LSEGAILRKVTIGFANLQSDQVQSLSLGMGANKGKKSQHHPLLGAIYRDLRPGILRYSGVEFEFTAMINIVKGALWVRTGGKVQIGSQPKNRGEEAFSFFPTRWRALPRHV